MKKEILEEKSRIIRANYSYCLKCGESIKVENLYCKNCVNEILGENECRICKRNIRSNELTGRCTHCLQRFHVAHLKEIVKIRGECPACGEQMKEEDITVNEDSSTRITSNRFTESMLSGRLGEPSVLTCIQCGNSLPSTAEKCPSCGFKREKCEICKKWISMRSVIGTCTHCHRVFHYDHVLNAVNSFGKCPTCREPLRRDEIRMWVTG